ncbi:DUF692 family protein [Streptomyces sp. P9(2023)]|uniref:multinuclear nonheme iron-dependent oxidase n=1 Tax=Streptomyces sp. P9(2023) TaxID=3064394 RepID=UPI0028F3E462|nr:DUF692 family multinuclear iron-containing protein [Streptomyces sp. P9(2023)]MDT9690133.1 DUF692 family protein [Streptomyces sp. P9(2023)]
MTELGIGIGWRPEIAGAVEALPGVDWVEVVAENMCAGHLPDPLKRLRSRGVTVVPHGVSLGLGGADRPDARRLADLAATATALGAPLVSEHIAFVRAGGVLTATPVLEAGHLLPVPRTWAALDVLCENVRIAQDSLPVPLALENIAALIAWPDEELTEGQFLAELVERTGVRLLIDVANLHTNHVNRGESPSKALSELPVEAIAYVHVAGGLARDGVWHDTHAHPVAEPVLDILSDLAARTTPPGVLLERDDNFPPAEELASELAAIRGRVAGARRAGTDGRPDVTAGHDPAEAGSATSGARAAEDAPLIGAGARVSGGLMPQSRRAAKPAYVTRGRLAAPGTDPAEVADGSVPAVEPRSARTSVAVADADADADERTAPTPTPRAPRGEAARERVAMAQAALLSALVAGTPVPEGFDSRRVGVQSRALVGKRTDVIAKIAPELPEILGDGYRPAFRAYARSRPMTGGYRRDALDFVEQLLVAGRPEDPDARRRLTHWWQERAGTRRPGPATRLARAARAALVRR